MRGGGDTAHDSVPSEPQNIDLVTSSWSSGLGSSLCRGASQWVSPPSLHESRSDLQAEIESCQSSACKLATHHEETPISPVNASPHRQTRPARTRFRTSTPLPGHLCLNCSSYPQFFSLLPPHPTFPPVEIRDPLRNAADPLVYTPPEPSVSCAQQEPDGHVTVCPGSSGDTEVRLQTRSQI